jgi:hypothetical protein
MGRSATKHWLHSAGRLVGTKNLPVRLLKN